MKKLALFIFIIVCAVSFSAPAWSKKDGDPPVVKTDGGDLHPASYIKF
jgi:hypothetical protein